MTHVIEGVHSQFGPSGADRWINCPGSHLAGQGLPERKSKYAAEGTVAHEMSLWVRQQRVPATHFLKQKLESDGFTFSVNKGMALGVQQFVDYCAPVPGDPFYEIKVGYENWVPGGFGTADDIRLADYLCTNTDLKFGTGHKVFAKRNPQLMLYSVGTYEKYKWAYEFSDFVLRIAQPRLNHWDVWTTTLAELKEWTGAVAAPAAARALRPGAPFKAGPWCTFCKLRDNCAVRAQYKQEKEARGRENDFAILDLS